jgi:chromosome segregation ATPase
MSLEQMLALIVVALITVTGTIYAARRSAKNERIKIDQAMVTVLGTEREKIAEELEKVRTRAAQNDEQMERVRTQLRGIQEEYSETKIVHREAIAEKDATIRERDASIRELQARQVELEAMLNACRTELGQARSELQNALTLIQQQAQALQSLRTGGHTGGGNPPTP